MKIKKVRKEIDTIILGGLIIRLLFLFFIFFITPDWSSGFIGNSVLQDDVRYEMGAIRYAELASSIFDPRAFSSAYSYYGDYVGYARNVFSSTPLWYWIVCFLYYIFRSTIVIRLFNIAMSILSISLIYKMLLLVFEEKIAILAAKLLAFLPYPVIFSCFSYKDNLIMVLTLFIIYYSLKYRTKESFNIAIVLKLASAFLALFMLRGGLSAILLVLCLGLIMFSRNSGYKKRITQKSLILAAAGMVAVYIMFLSMDSITRKFQYYITGRDLSGLGGISIVTITSIKDIYKLPLTLLYAIVTPIGFSGTLDSWSEIVGILNVCMASIAVGAVLDIFLHKKDERIFIIGCVIYYIISIVSSIGIFRHYYSLIFVPILLYSHLKYHAHGLIKNMWMIGASLYFIALVMYVVI